MQLKRIWSLAVMVPLAAMLLSAQKPGDMIQHRQAVEDAILAAAAAKAKAGKSISQLGRDWSIQFSSGVPKNPATLPTGAGWIFAFPRYDNDAAAACWSVSAATCGWVGYITTSYTAPPVQGQTLSMTATVDTTGPATFGFDTEQGNTCPTPATVRFLIQRARDNYSKDGYRWWSNPVALILAPGTATVSVAIDPSQWSGIFGERADQDATTLSMWNAALTNIGDIGMTFGGGCFFGHGVYVAGADATFSMLSFTIQ